MTAAPLSVLVPVAIACGLAALSPFIRRRGGYVAIVATLATLVLAAIALPDRGERVVVWFGGWEPRDGVAVGVGFAIDGLGGGLAVFVAVLGVAAAVISSRVITVDEIAFDALALVVLAAMVGFCLTGDLFNMFVFFELMSVSAYVLVGYEVRQRAALEGSLTFAVTNSVGSILLLFGIALVYGRSGALNLAQIGATLTGGPHDTLLVVAFALVVSGLLVKAAIVPFHLWTADAYAVAPTPICIMLAGAFSELGLYGVARVYWSAFHGALEAHTPELRAVFIVAGLLTAVLGAVMCAAQHHLKRMLAFATIAQVGLFLVGIGLLSAEGIGGTAVWIVADGLVKAALFACVAVLQHRYGAVEEADLHGRARELWPVGLLFVIGALMIASLPGAGPFLGKTLVEDAALAAGGYDWVPAVMLVATGLVAGTLLRAAARVFWGLGPAPARDPAGDEAEEEAPERESGDGKSPLIWGPATVLLAASAAWGIVPGLRAAAGRAVAAFVDQPGYAAAVLEGRAAAPLPAALHAPNAGAYLYAAGTIALALVVAAVALGREHSLPRPLAAAVEVLRGVHDGRPGDYVAWTVAGVALLAGVFALALQ